MPSSTRNRGSSPSKSTINSTPGTPKTNIVKRVAIEGKAERNSEGKAEGASIKMYLRIALPVNTSVPGSTIPLFPDASNLRVLAQSNTIGRTNEENLKILDSQVHPLDNNAVPYNFSTTASPLLKRAARALNLPARSKDSYMSVFGSLASSSTSASSTSPLDERYTGHILVSQYQISYVLPKEYPPSTRSYDSSYGRRSSAYELQFMAAIDIWIPYVSKPPSYPYLLSIPVPRCLSNYIKLKIFAPGSLAGSAASLSSTEGDSWDLASEPHVARQRSLSRTSSYQSFADDESSDSSGGGPADGYRLQGSFPSTDYMRVRWASPMKPADIEETSDGRRRAGIKAVNGDMVCVVLDKKHGTPRGRSRGYNDTGVKMKVEFSATCRGIWYPGVATMLGMDVALDAGDNDVFWGDEEQKWTVTGGSGFTGFAIGRPPQSTPRKSTETPPIFIQPSTPNGKVERANDETQRWTGSSASLLRAPLPSGADDSFSDVSPHNTPLSSVASLTTVPSSPEKRSRANSGAEEDQTPSPKVPISVHFNMNELVTPRKNVFKFTISGTILVRPPRKATNSYSDYSTSGSDSDSDSEPMVLPKFHVLHAEHETINTIVRNSLGNSVLDLKGVEAKTPDGQPLQASLQPGNQTSLGAEGAVVAAVKSIASQSEYTVRPNQVESPNKSGRRTPSRPRTPNGFLQRSSSSASLRQTYVLATPLKPKRDGELMIPKVTATVDILPVGYDVEVSLLAPTDTDSEWLEFSIAHPPAGEGRAPSHPGIEVASATVDGVPVRFETTVSDKPNAKVPALGFPMDENALREQMTWVKVHVGETGGGKVEVTYAVLPEIKNEEAEGSAKRKDKAVEPTPLHVLLPCFGLRVGRMEVHIPPRADMNISVKDTNLEPPQVSASGLLVLVGRRLEEFFNPQLTITAIPLIGPEPLPGLSRWWSVMAVVSAIIAVLAVLGQQGLASELARTKQALAEYSSLAAYVPEPDTVTTTTTSYLSTTSTTTLYATITVTTTIQPQVQESSAAAEPVPAMSTSSRTPNSHTSAVPTATPTVPTITPTPVASPTNGVSAIRDLPFLWPIHFDIPPIDLPATARVTADALLRGLGFAWKLCRKLYHYPLDPP